MQFDPAPYAAGIRRSNERERENLRECHLLAIDESERAAGVTAAADPGVERITLFGSTAAGVPNSADIDIVIEGGDLYRALESTEKCEFTVDVVEPARLPRHMQESIRKSGRILFDRDSAKR